LELHRYASVAVKGVRQDMHTTKEVIDTHREQLIQHESDIKHINARLENFSAERNV
jgi:hypothetical protein